MTQLTARLEELKKLCESATGERWIVGNNRVDVHSADKHFTEVCTTFYPGDAELIAQSRELVPRLIVALELAIKQRDLAIKHLFAIPDELTGAYIGEAKANIEFDNKQLELILCEQGGR